MFYTKTIKYLLIRNDCIEKKIENFKKEYESKLDNTYKHIEQLEKRINTLSDYIQGPYTKQINENFTQINLQIQAILDKKLKQKIEKRTIKACKQKKVK